MKIFANTSLRFLGNLDVQSVRKWTNGISHTLNNCNGTLLFFTDNDLDTLHQRMNLTPSDVWGIKIQKYILGSCLQIPVGSSNAGGDINLTQITTNRNSIIGDWYQAPEGINCLKIEGGVSTQSNLNGLKVLRHKIQICNDEIGGSLSGTPNRSNTSFDLGRNIPVRSSIYVAKGSLLDSNTSYCGVLSSSVAWRGTVHHFYNGLRFQNIEKFNWLYISRYAYNLLAGIRYWDHGASAWRDVNTGGVWNETYMRANSPDLNVLFRFPERESSVILLTTRMDYAGDVTMWAKSIAVGHTDNVYSNIPNDTIKWCLYIPNLDASPIANGLAAGNLSNLSIEDYPMSILPVGDADSDAPIRLDSLNIGHTDQPQTKQLVYGRIKYELR